MNASSKSPLYVLFLIVIASLVITACGAQSYDCVGTTPNGNKFTLNEAKVKKFTEPVKELVLCIGPNHWTVTTEGSASENSVASAEAAVPAQIDTPAAQAQTASYEVKGDTVEVFADGALIAKVKFLTAVDNMPTEWLRDREAIAYLYQSGIGNQVKLEVTLMENGSFAADGDAFQVGETTLGKVNDSADALVFADTPGKYTITGWSFGIAFGPYKAEDDKAGYVLKDRHNAINWDGRPEYWLNPTGKPVQVGQ